VVGGWFHGLPFGSRVLLAMRWMILENDPGVAALWAQLCLVAESLWWLRVTVVVVVAVVVMAGTVFLITHVRVFWKQMSFLLLASAISSSSSSLSTLLSASGRSFIATPIML
jgi:hypothetical protein